VSGKVSNVLYVWGSVIVAADSGLSHGFVDQPWIDGCVTERYSEKCWALKSHSRHGFAMSPWLFLQVLISVRWSWHILAIRVVSALNQVCPPGLVSNEDGDARGVLQLQRPVENSAGHKLAS
jgi:hypothetical protein